MLYLVPPQPRPRNYRTAYRPNLAIRVMRAAGRAATWTVFAVRILYLRLCAWDLRRYLRECDEDGLSYSLSLSEFNRQLDQMEARLVLLRAGTWA